MFVHGDLDGAGVALGVIVACDGVRHRPSNVVGEIQVEVVDGDIHGCSLAVLQPLTEIGRHGNDGNHGQVMEKDLGPGRIDFLEAKDVGIPKGLCNTDALRAAVLHDQCHRTAPHGNSSQGLYKQEDQRGNEGRRDSDGLPQPYPQILGRDHPCGPQELLERGTWMRRCGHVVTSRFRNLHQLLIVARRRVSVIRMMSPAVNPARMRRFPPSPRVLRAKP